MQGLLRFFFLFTVGLELKKAVGSAVLVGVLKRCARHKTSARESLHADTRTRDGPSVAAFFFLVLARQRLRVRRHQ